MILAAASIAGGLFLAFKKVEGDSARQEAARVEAAKATAAPTPASGDTVKSAGPCSPVYSGVTVGGSMEQNFDCSAQSDPKADGADKK